MKIAYISYYFPPDIGAGAFRSETLVRQLNSKLKKGDKLIIISSVPNRYKKKKIKNKSRNIFRINQLDHKEHFFLKTMTGIFYFFSLITILLKTKPDVIVLTSARFVTSLAGYISSKILNVKYCIDIRDLFVPLIKEILGFKIYPFVPILKFLEKKIIENALSVNLVSKEFKKYLKLNKILVKNISYYTNGYDKNFLIKKKYLNKKYLNGKKVVMYAGNVGDGQSLHKVIPYVAKKFSNLNFIIIGGGGKHKILKNLKLKMGIENLKLIQPTSKKKLLKYYKKADYLFLQLNNYNTLRYVIPSKIFEYAAINIPIIAGLEGYSKKFCEKNFKNFYFYKPNDKDSCIKLIKNLNKKKKFEKNNNIQLKKFDKDYILNNYAKHILKNIYEKKNYNSIQ